LDVPKDGLFNEINSSRTLNPSVQLLSVATQGRILIFLQTSDPGAVLSANDVATGESIGVPKDGSKTKSTVPARSTLRYDSFQSPLRAAQHFSCKLHSTSHPDAVLSANDVATGESIGVPKDGSKTKSTVPARSTLRYDSLHSPLRAAQHCILIPTRGQPKWALPSILRASVFMISSSSLPLESSLFNTGSSLAFSLEMIKDMSPTILATGFLRTCESL